MEYRVTNHGNAPRGMAGAGWVKPGQTVTVELDDARVVRLRRFLAIESVGGEEQEADRFADTTDDELRTAVEEKTGKKPHHKTGRAKLIEALA